MTARCQTSRTEACTTILISARSASIMMRGILFISVVILVFLQTAAESPFTEPAEGESSPLQKDCYVTSIGGKTEGSGKCHFPFTYNDVVYHDCSRVHSDGFPWCSTTANYEKDKIWAFCDTRVCNVCYTPTFSGSAGKARCMFPFTYRGVTYNDCAIIHSDGYPWCFTTSNYKQDRLWAFCGKKVCQESSEKLVSKKSLFVHLLRRGLSVDETS